MHFDNYFTTRHSVEHCFIGCLLQEAEATVEAAVKVGLASPEFIENDFGRSIYESALNLMQDGNPVDGATVFADICKRKLFEKSHAEVAKYIAESYDMAPTPAAARYFAEIILDAVVVEKLNKEGERIKTKTISTNEPIELAKETSVRFADIAKTIAVETAQISTSTDALRAAMIRLDEIRNLTGARRILFGIDSLDKFIHLLPRTLVTIAARPGIGKTALAGQLCLNATQKNVHVVFVTLEMSAADITQRMLAHLSGVSLNNIRRAMTQQELDSFESAKRLFATLPVHFIERGSMTCDELASECGRLVKLHNAQLLIVDYAQLVLPSKDCSNREQEVASVYATLRRFTGDYNIVTVALAQLNRDVEKSAGEPKLSHIRESGAAESDSDVVMFLHAPQDKPEAPTKIIWRKNRGGVTSGHVDCDFNKPVFTFEEIEKEMDMPKTRSTYPE